MEKTGTEARQQMAIPKPLWKLHGREASPADLLLTYLLALAAAVFCVSQTTSLPVWKIGLVALLALDTAGGVVSNFTAGTIAYYRKAAISPYVFIWLHVGQAAALAYVYPDFLAPIALLSGLVLLFSSVLIAACRVPFRPALGICLFCVLLAGIVSCSGLPQPASLLLLLFGVKLILGFAGHWAGERPAS